MLSRSRQGPRLLSFRDHAPDDAGAGGRSKEVADLQQYFKRDQLFRVGVYYERRAVLCKYGQLDQARWVSGKRMAWSKYLLPRADYY